MSKGKPETANADQSSQAASYIFKNAGTLDVSTENYSVWGSSAGARIYQNVGHGFGLGIGTKAEGWLDDAVRFWEKHMCAAS